VKSKILLFPKASGFILKKFIAFLDKLQNNDDTASKNFLPDLNDGCCPTIRQIG
jgi:hypothetical protein